MRATLAVSTLVGVELDTEEPPQALITVAQASAMTAAMALRRAVAPTIAGV